MIRAGDVVLHGPTGESWVVAAVSDDDLAWAGWPEGMARTQDCTLVRPCSDADHVAMVARCVGREGDRGRLSRWHSCGVCVAAKGVPDV